MNMFELIRAWFDWCYENPDKIRPAHTALYIFCVEHCNRLGWKEKFGLPTTMAKEAIGIHSYNTFINTLNDIVEFGFIQIIQRSKNQYSSNIIALSKIDKATDKALDKAFIKHGIKHSESTVQSTDSIIIPINNITKDQLTILQNNTVRIVSNLDTVIDHLDYLEIIKGHHNLFLDLFIELTGKKIRKLSGVVIGQVNARLTEGYTLDDFATVIKNIKADKFHKDSGYKYLTPEFVSRNDKFSQYLNIQKIDDDFPIMSR